jgi:hypothetical protein
MINNVTGQINNATKSLRNDNNKMPENGLDPNKIVGEADEAKDRQIWIQAQMTRISSEASTAEIIFKTINKINDRIANSRV